MFNLDYVSVETANANKNIYADPNNKFDNFTSDCETFKWQQKNHPSLIQCWIDAGNKFNTYFDYKSKSLNRKYGSVEITLSN